MDPDPGFGAFFNPGLGMEKIRIRDSGWTSLVIFRRSYKFFLVKNYLNSLMRIRIRDLFDPESGIRDGKIRIQEKHPGSATMEKTQKRQFYVRLDHIRICIRTKITIQNPQSSKHLDADPERLAGNPPAHRWWWNSPSSPSRLRRVPPPLPGPDPPASAQ